MAEYDEAEQMLTYRETIEYSGNSTIQVVILDKNVQTNNIREKFTSYGCESEKFSEGYFVMEVLANQDYGPIREKLVELENQNIISFAEPVLGENHWY